MYRGRSLWCDLDFDPVTLRWPFKVKRSKMHVTPQNEAWASWVQKWLFQGCFHFDEFLKQGIDNIGFLDRLMVSFVPYFASWPFLKGSSSSIWNRMMKTEYWSKFQFSNFYFTIENLNFESFSISQMVILFETRWKI